MNIIVEEVDDFPIPSCSSRNLWSEEDETMVYRPVETAEILESDRGNQRHAGPSHKGIHDTGFEIQHSHSRNPSNQIEQLIMEEMKY
jgi:hypothetical protein